MKISEAKDIAGTLGAPSKMPGTAYGISAFACKTGAKLAQIPGSVCHGCYAMKGNYTFPNVQGSQAKRLAGITDQRWVEAMVTLLDKSGETYHRWHDSGDLQSVEHLAKIVLVAKATPSINHWLPTREGATVKQYVDAGGIIPKNLVIRISATMIDGPAPTWWGLTSTVHTVRAPDGARTCPAPTQGNECGDCRACWSPEVKSVSYHKH